MDENCPYCESDQACEHLLLLIDLTFRTAEGGLLAESFNGRWSKIREEHEGDQDFEEREPFDDLIAEIESISDAIIYYDFDGGPGMSSSYAGFFSQGAQSKQNACESFDSLPQT